MDVCPVDCFREGSNVLVIDPDECIDGTLCVAECPVAAIFADDDVPGKQRALLQRKADGWRPRGSREGRAGGMIAGGALGRHRRR